MRLNRSAGESAPVPLRRIGSSCSQELLGDTHTGRRHAELDLGARRHPPTCPHSASSVIYGIASDRLSKERDSYGRSVVFENSLGPVSGIAVKLHPCVCECSRNVKWRARPVSVRAIFVGPPWAH
jgi:hypothetical protein